MLPLTGLGGVGLEKTQAPYKPDWDRIRRRTVHQGADIGRGGLKSLFSHKRKTLFSSPDIFVLKSWYPTDVQLNHPRQMAPRVRGDLVRYQCRPPNSRPAVWPPNSCLVEHIIRLHHQLQQNICTRSSEWRSAHQWHVKRSSLRRHVYEHQAKFLRIHDPATPPPAAGGPAVPVKIHETSRASPATSDSLWDPRRTVRTLPGDLGLLGVWRCIFFYFTISSVPLLPQNAPVSRLLRLLDLEAAAADAAVVTLLTWRWADFRLLTAAKCNTGLFCGRSASVNWLTAISCWAPQHPHFIWPIITERSLLSKYHRCNTGRQTAPALVKRYVSPPHVAAELMRAAARRRYPSWQQVKGGGAGVGGWPATQQRYSWTPRYQQ